jgi:hypothetical protein
MCRVLGVSRSGYYAWARRAPSARTVANTALIEEIWRVHADSEGALRQAARDQATAP